MIFDLICNIFKIKSIFQITGKNLIYPLIVFLILSIFNNFSLSQNYRDPQWNQNQLSRLNFGATYSPMPKVQDDVKRDMTTKFYRTPRGDFTVYPNFIPLPTFVTTESEVAACTMTGNQNVLFAGWITYGPSSWNTGFCYSSNGGFNWTGDSLLDLTGQNYGDPCVWIWSNLSSWHGRIGITMQGPVSITSSYSTNNGISWHSFVNVGGNTPDKALSCVDDVPGSPFLGRAYTVWTDFGGVYINRICGAYSSDGGASWNGYKPISPVPVSDHMCTGCDVSTGPGGVVYVVWANCGQYSVEDSLGFAKSTDGGVTWLNTKNNAVDINGIRSSCFLPTCIRVNSFLRLAIDKSGGVRNGWIYVTLTERSIAPALDSADITLCRSTDGGTTWSHSKVNQDPPGALQWFPSICVNSNGNIAIGYYDERGLTKPVTQYYLSFSNDGGNTWTDFLASDHTFIPEPIINSGYQGDYTGITYSNSYFFPFWMDNSSGLYQVWTTPFNTVPPAHDIAIGPFLSLPNYILVGNSYNIKTKVTNVGTSAESNIPVKWFVNNTLINTNYISLLTSGQIDSASNSWTPVVPGSYNLKYVSSLLSDTNHFNDTIKTNIVIRHDIAVEQWLSFPQIFYTNTVNVIKAQIHNVGNFNESNVPIKFYTNGTLISTTIINLNGNLRDSISNNWVPTIAGNYILKYLSALPTDSVHSNDSIQTTVTVYATPPDLCEGFNSTNFPPVGWTLSGVGTNYWSRLSPSGYNLGIGSARYQCWYAPIGNIGNLTSLYFSTTGNNDSLFFDYAYCPFQAFTDSLIILSSTDNGVSWPNVLIKMGVGQLTTTGNCSNSEFIPSIASDWASKKLALPTGTNRVRFSGISYMGNDIWIDSVCIRYIVGIQKLSSKVPDAYMLYQNYPNPFNPITKIKFDIPSLAGDGGGDVKLIIYDILGREVTTLVNEKLKSGTYNISWDGTNYSSGLYFYRLQSDKFSETKKLVLLK